MTTEWSRLYHVIAEDDGSTWKPTPDELREWLEPSSTFDPELQTWAVWAGERMVAFADVSVRGTPAFDGLNTVHLSGGVDPHWRGRGLGSMLLKSASERGIGLARTHLPGAPLALRCETTDTAPASHALLEDHGYQQVRYWFDMSHHLRGEFTEDARTCPITPELSAAVRRAHNDAFSTHWGSGPISEEDWQRFQRSQRIRPDLSRVVVDGGEVLAYAIVSSSVPGEAYFDLIGVRGSAQGRGLGRAVVTSALAAIRAEGTFTNASLDVDADNPSGAGRLYTAAGFTTTARKITWERRL